MALELKSVIETNLIKVNQHRINRYFNSSILYVLLMYGKARFKLYTRVQVHACACTFNACKTSKTGVCTHCCMRFWHAHVGKQ